MLSARSPQDIAQSESNGIAVTASDLNPVVQILTWLLLALASLMLCFRILTNFWLKSLRKPEAEDVLILGAYIFSVGECLSMLLPGSRIFGKTIQDVSLDELRTGLKIGYARDLLLIISLGLAKQSVNTSVYALSPDQTHRRMSFALGIIIALWTLISFLTTAFQCGAQEPWDRTSSHCFDLQVFYQYISITNILTDVALIALPIVVIWPLRMPLAKLATAMAFFMFRVLVVAASIAQLIYIPRLFDEDWTLHAWPYFMCTQLVQFASISAACVVYFLPLIRSLQSGLPWSARTSFTASYTLSKITETTRGESTTHATRPQPSWSVDSLLLNADIATYRSSQE